MRYKVEQVKARLNYFAFYILHAGGLSSTGNGWFRVTSCCPFHNDKKPGTLHVNTRNGAYHCFACGEKGDVFRFLMKTKNISFKEAFKILKKEAGV